MINYKVMNKDGFRIFGDWFPTDLTVGILSLEILKMMNSDIESDIHFGKIDILKETVASLGQA